MHTIKVIGIGFSLLGILLVAAPRLAVSAGRPIPLLPHGEPIRELI